MTHYCNRILNCYGLRIYYYGRDLPKRFSGLLASFFIFGNFCFFTTAQFAGFFHILTVTFFVPGHIIINAPIQISGCQLRSQANGFIKIFQSALMLTKLLKSISPVMIGGSFVGFDADGLVIVFNGPFILAEIKRSETAVFLCFFL
mgnify:CR=1 FL=1